MRTLCDADVGAAGTLLLFRDSDGYTLATEHSEFAFTARVEHPRVRWVRPGLILVVGTRSEGDPNAHLTTDRGELIRSFFVGDGIEEVMVCGGRIVVAYFDEGVFGDYEVGREGLAIFDTRGELLWGYTSQFGADAVDVVDCYGVCTDGVDRVWFSPALNHPLVELDVERRTQTVRTLPAAVHGCSGMSAAPGSIYFAFPDAWIAMRGKLPDAGTVQDLSRHRIFRWDAVSGAVDPAGEAHARLRGLPNGRFMEVSGDGWRIITPDRGSR